MNALAGLMNPAAVGQSFQLGMEQGRARRGEMETQNALSMLAKDPNSAEGFEKLAFYQPQAAMQIRQQRDEAAAQEREADLTSRFLGGDETAADELARVNFERYSKIDAQTKAQALEESTMFGNAALDVLQAPTGPQRNDRIITYAQQMPQFREKIEELAYLPPAEQEAQLRAVVAQAKLIGRLHEMEKPQTLNVQPGAGVYERDPRSGAISTVIQPNYGGAAPFSPVQGGAPSPADIDAELRRRGVR